MNNFYNSVRLKSTLLGKNRTTRTLRDPTENWIYIISKTIKLKTGEYRFYRIGSIYISVEKDKRAVFTITTGFRPTMATIKIRRSVGIQKSIPVIECNENMFGIGRCDQMLLCYSSPRKTIKRYKKVLFHLFDITIWNSFYLFKKKIFSL